MISDNEFYWLVILCVVLSLIVVYFIIRVEGINKWYWNTTVVFFGGLILGGIILGYTIKYMTLS